jgi:RNA polymerase sigma-70 factor (ECF subfamily)
MKCDLRAGKDVELWQLVRNQDDARAFEVIYDRYRNTLCAIAQSRLRHLQNSEDIVHEVFIRIWVRRKRLDIANLESYLITCVIYGVTSFLRKTGRWQVYLPGDALPELAAPGNPEHIFHGRALEQMMRGHIEKLPGQCKLVYKYSREQGLKTAEIAAKMDLSPRTVERHLFLALKRLSKLVHPESSFSHHRSL